MSGIGRLPTLLLVSVFALQGIVGVLTLVQPLAPLPSPLQSWAAPLVGVRVSPPTIDASVRQVLDGRFQRAVETWVADHLTQRPAIVRTYNELQWQGFGTSVMSNRILLRAPDGAIYDEGYVLAYCGIKGATDVANLPVFARRLRAAQDWFKSRGRPLVYYMSPIKPTWFKGPFPTNFPCPAEKRDTLRPIVRAAFDRAGVDYVDGPAALEAARGRVPVELFPRNGIHWNQLGAAIGIDALLAKFRDLGVRLPAFSYRFVIQNDETGIDRDIADLLNLLWPPPGVRAPQVEVTPAEPPGTLRLAAVNDSFFQNIPLALLGQGRIFQSETMFGYLTVEQSDYRHGVIHRTATEALRTVLDADVVVLEEVESRVGGGYALKFLDLIDAEMAREASAAVPR